MALKYNSRAAHAAGFVDLRPGMQDDGNFGTTRLATVAMTLPTKYQQIARDAEAGRPDAQFLLSQICMQNGDTRGMMLWKSSVSW